MIVALNPPFGKMGTFQVVFAPVDTVAVCGVVAMPNPPTVLFSMTRVNSMLWANVPPVPLIVTL